MKMYKNNNKFTVWSPGLQSYLRLKILLFLRKKLRRTSPGLQYGPGWNHDRRNIQQGYATNKGNFILKKKQKKMSSLFPPVYFFFILFCLMLQKKENKSYFFIFFFIRTRLGVTHKRSFFLTSYIFLTFLLALFS